MLFRFGVIFPLLDGNLKYGQKTAIIKELTGRTYEIPGSTRSTISGQTIRNWLDAYGEHGLDGLAPRKRSDSGDHRVLSTETELELRRFRDQHPDWKLTTLVSRAAKNGLFLPSEKVSMDVIYRIFSDYTKERKARTAKDMRRFEMENCNDCWMLDSMVGPKARVDMMGREAIRTVFLWAFIDDKSRLVTHGEFYPDQKAESLLACLWTAMSARGLPRRIFTDNGSAMKDARLRLGCADLEVSLTYAKIYSPTSKAKIERFFSTVRMQFMPTIEGAPLTLRELNRRWSGWLSEYNSRYHSGIGMAPVECYMDNIKAIRPAPADMSKHFRACEDRLVSDVRTVQFRNRLLEVPLGHAGHRIQLRFFTKDGPIEAFYQGESLGFLSDVDLVGNSSCHRLAPKEKSDD